VKDRVFLARTILYSAALVIVLALADAALTPVAERSRWPAELVDIQTPGILYAKLEHLRRFSGYKAAVFGDSVVFGHALAEHGDEQWRKHNIAALLEDRLRDEMPDRDVLVMNLGLNGALPADVERVQQFVAACRPDLVVFDLGLRSFSSDFSRAETLFSRPWLAQMTYEADGRVALSDSAATGHAVEDVAEAFALRGWSLFRFRDLIQYRLLGGPPRERSAAWRTRLGQALGSPTPEADDEIPLLLKAQRRFQGIQLAAENPQRQALERLLGRLAESRQKSLVFYAKEDPSRIENLMDPQRYDRLRTELDALVQRYAGPELVYLPPLAELAPEHYLDHSHVTYAGYQILADAMWQRLRPMVRGGTR
jgi:lysophospholipase L1-like esterase